MLNFVKFCKNKSIFLKNNFKGGKAMNRWFDNLPLIGNKIPGKIILSFLMLLLSTILLLCFQTNDRAFCAIAVIFSFIGDIFLNYKKVPKRSKRSFIFGTLSFAIAHIFFFFAYCYKIAKNHYIFFNAGIVIPITILVLITLLFLLTSKDRSIIFKLCLGYIWITGINYITIFSYAFSANNLAYLSALGGLLFLASDVIIGLEKFLGLKSKIARELVWWFYPIGQILIILFA